ncbi:MAG: TldD/PmbA family protein [Bacteroidetes bacterium]|nr:TldD/PmbA family protein [Bacteroidota bacterium]
MKKPDLPDDFRPDLHFLPPARLTPSWLTSDVISKLASFSIPDQVLFGELRFSRQISFESGKASLHDPVFSSGFSLSDTKTGDELLLPFTFGSLSSFFNLRSARFDKKDLVLNRFEVQSGPKLPTDPSVIMEMLYRCNDWIRQKSKEIINVAFQAESESRQVLGITEYSPGFIRNEVHSDWMCTVYLRRKGKIFSGSSRLGERDSVSGAQVSDPFKVVLAALQKAEFAAGSHPIENGFYDILLPPGWGMMFFHEIIGHACEADNESGIFSSLRDKTGSELLTISDEGLFPGGRGSLGCDDEGTPVSKTLLIEKGRFHTLLADRKTADVKGIHPTGNGRRSGFDQPVQTRMTNTIVHPGNSSRIQLFNQISEGIEVTDSGNGIVNSETGDFKFEILHGYLIKNGKRKHPVYNLQIVGKIQDALEKVVGVGNDFYLETSTGFCDKKGQRVPISVGGPSVLLEKLRVIGLPA